MQLSSNIKYIRLLSGLTQAEFAKKIGANRDMVYTYEAGKAKPDQLKLLRIANFAGVGVEELTKTDLTKKEIRVIDPDSKDMVYTLNTADQAAKIIELEAQIKTLQSLIDKLLQKIGS